MTLLTLAVMFAGLSLVRAAINADLIVAPGGRAVTVLSIAVPLALFFAFLVWSNLTKGIIEAYDGTVAIVRNWAVSCGGLILFLSYLLPMKTPAGFHVARAAGAILLAIGALIARSKLGHWLAAPGAPVSGAAGRQSASADDAYDRVNLPSGVDDPRRGQPQQQSAQIVELPLSAEPQPEDWNASRWDPEVQEDIERRRRRGRPTV
ncbi:hypothetical protein [Micromonospora purpureochromogenes]|uniref:EamA domain-containing protein n=1 Tax=Micromonospora purpureochromogenes TaxID=47872 RepID=A0ABX2RTT1_9ACTN|nr:hypothetical protein [Micromonospora purpureochromogenes]NYF59940.1 hypothetical protein [Micromonospora purpureochromogenes]